ncbi:hypothetical protein BYT27DRAFT_7214747 [Phlegmacium glaucopus]|nr:hypothetical protein BYT27DRAFT_7214747 [Phlegmacium glaucopus]
MATSDQCALGPDGTMLEPSEIIWFNDPDNPTPIPPIGPIQQAGAFPHFPPKSPTIHLFFHGGPPPVTMVAGSQCSTHVSHPSKRVLDPDNSECPNVLKRPRPSCQKNVVESDSDEKDEDSVDDGDGDGAANTEGFAYTATKVMGNINHEALANCPKSDRTANIRTIFKCNKEHVNSETGVTEDGHWCTLCQDAGIQMRSCFFLGSVTSLRNYIARNAGHVKIYTEQCKKLGIVTNERVYAKSDSLESIGPTKQGTLDSFSCFR